MSSTQHWHELGITMVTNCIANCHHDKFGDLLAVMVGLRSNGCHGKSCHGNGCQGND